MIHISNNDASTLRRLLGRLQGIEARDNKDKNLKRQAMLLLKRLDNKISKEDGKSRAKLLQCRY
jgi:hypothetical protein